MRKAIALGLLLCLAMPSFAQTTEQWRDSLSVLTKAIDRMPRSVDLRLKKAAVNLELGQWEYAVEEYGRVMELDHNNLSALYFRAYANNQLRRYELAKTDYERILSMVPKHFEAQLGLAMSYRKMGNRMETMDQLNQLVQLFPDSALAFAARAGYEAEVKMYDAALFDWDEALRMDSMNVDFLVSKVNVMLLMNRKREARRELRHAIERGIDAALLREWMERCK